MREVIATGRNVEEATENGCRELGKSRDEVSVEILEMPVKKFFKTLPAKVKVTVADYQEPEKPAAPAPPKAEPKAAPPKAAPAAPVSEPKNQPEAAEKPAEKPQVPKADVLAKEPEEPIDLKTDAPSARAADYLLEIFHAIGSKDVRIQAFRQGDATLFRVEGEDIADVVEIRGETVQALSYLTDRSVNRGVDKKAPDYIRVRLDVAGYRGRRESELVALANRTAKEVVKNNRSRTLAPMNPYERLIIHTTISQMEGVVSESIGSDTERRVVVKSTAPGAKDGDDWMKPRSGGRGGRRDSGGRSGNSSRRGGNDRRRDQRPKKEYGGPPRTNTPEREYANKPHNPDMAPIVPEQRDAIKDGEDLPLYGKIELD